MINQLKSFRVPSILKPCNLFGLRSPLLYSHSDPEGL